MRSTGASLLAHMAGAGTTLALLVKITRTDNVVLAVTDHDVDLVYPAGGGGVTYKTALAMDASAIQTNAALNVDNLDVKGFLSALGVSEADIAAGLWDYADVRIYRVNWADLTMGDEKLIRGWIGDISVGRNEFNNEIRSLTQKLQSRIVDNVTENCKADLFDSRCGLTATEGVWKFSAVAVSTIVSASRQFTCAALGQAAGFFTAGKVTWSTGLNAGLSKEIKTHAASGNILLQEPMPYAIAPADTLVIYAGCIKRYSEDCVTKFSNGNNFRGFPFLPGTDAVLRGPQ